MTPSPRERWCDLPRAATFDHSGHAWPGCSCTHRGSVRRIKFVAISSGRVFHQACSRLYLRCITFFTTIQNPLSCPMTRNPRNLNEISLLCLSREKTSVFSDSCHFQSLVRTRASSSPLRARYGIWKILRAKYGLNFSPSGSQLFVSFTFSRSLCHL